MKKAELKQQIQAQSKKILELTDRIEMLKSENKKLENARLKLIDTSHFMDGIRRQQLEKIKILEHKLGL